MEAIHAGLGALGARRWARRKRATAVTCVATAVAPTVRAWFNRGAGTQRCRRALSAAMINSITIAMQARNCSSQT